MFGITPGAASAPEGKVGESGSVWKQGDNLAVVVGGKGLLGKAKGGGKVADGGNVDGRELAVPEDQGGEPVVAMDLEKAGQKRGADNQSTPARAGALRGFKSAGVALNSVPGFPIGGKGGENGGDDAGGDGGIGGNGGS